MQTTNTKSDETTSPRSALPQPRLMHFAVRHKLTSFRIQLGLRLIPPTSASCSCSLSRPYSRKGPGSRSNDSSIILRSTMFRTFRLSLHLDQHKQPTLFCRFGQQHFPTRMSSSFRVVEHIVNGSHTRDYIAETANGDSDMPKLSVKQYIPLDNPTPKPGDLTIIGAHANGFPKVIVVV